MSADLKKELLAKISASNDKNLLLLLKTDFDYFSQESNRDITDELSQEDKDELSNLVSEPFGKDTISQQELDEAIRQWGIK